MLLNFFFYERVISKIKYSPPFVSIKDLKERIKINYLRINSDYLGAVIKNIINKQVAKYLICKSVKCLKYLNIFLNKANTYTSHFRNFKLLI